MADNVKAKKKLVNPFCPSFEHVKGVKLNRRKYRRISSGTVDKETLRFSPVYEEYDLVEEIEANKKLCGLEYMKTLLKTGRVTAEDLADNAGANYDLSQVPDNVHEAKEQADALNEELAKVAQASGLEDGHSYTPEQFEEAVKKATAAAIQEIQAKQAAAASGDNKEVK